MKITAPVLAIAASLSLAACASMKPAEPPRAPQPVSRIDPASFYAGSWKEIARTPLKITDGCVAGETRFYNEGGKLIDRDSCRMGDPVAGKEKVFAGPVTILDPGTNAKFRTDYKVAGLFTVKREYWILDHGADWFVVANPAFTEASIFTRTTQPSATTKAQLTDRLKSFGFDVARLEWPAQPPA